MPFAPAPVTYLLRDVPPETWAAFKARAEAEDRTLRDVLLAFVTAYATDGAAITTTTTTTTTLAERRPARRRTR
jgi:hypothetical protein